MKYSSEYWNDVKLVVDQICNLKNLSGKKVLITGCTGMICSSVVDIITFLNKEQNANIKLYLAGRNSERVAYRFKDTLSSYDYEFVQYDATQSQTIDLQVDYIIHGASNANPAIFAKEPVETLLGNIFGLKSILELARLNPNSRVLLVSSSEVYGNRSDAIKDPYLENDYGFVDILNPRACYPTGKRASETLCAAYYQEYKVDFVTVRPGHIYGPSITLSDSRASAAFTRAVAAGENIVMKSAGTQLRSYCYTLDCASAILTVLINGESANAYNISNKNSLATIRDIADELAKAGGVEVHYENPSDIEMRSYNLMSISALNAQKLEKLGWKAVFDLETGVKRTLLFY